MTRERAFQVSDALAGAGFSHTIQVGVSVSLTPPRSYRVGLQPLSLGHEDIKRLQQIAEAVGCGLGYGSGAFAIVEPS